MLATVSGEDGGSRALIDNTAVAINRLGPLRHSRTYQNVIPAAYTCAEQQAHAICDSAKENLGKWSTLDHLSRLYTLTSIFDLSCLLIRLNELPPKIGLTDSQLRE